MTDSTYMSPDPDLNQRVSHVPRSTPAADLNGNKLIVSRHALSSQVTVRVANDDNSKVRNLSDW